ncbi:exosome component Rrp6 isoform X2 [Rhodnius prolixus]|uniref:exosome component Rrp6 isoform X2 n=1 Tax=Rhodnius prolixus TaxID=13249 RepID=UPI003D18DB3D
MDVNKGASTSKDGEQVNLVKEDDILPGCSSFEDFIQTAYPFLMNCVKWSNCFPADKQYSSYATIPEFKNTMKEQELELQNIIQKLLHYCGSKRSIAAQCPDDKFDLIIDMNDILLERVSKNLHEMDGTGRNPIALGNDFGEAFTPAKNICESWNKKQFFNSSSNYKELPVATLSRRNEQNSQSKIPKPQIQFKEKIDNSNETWVPKIKEKPNALKPLSILLTRDEKDNECFTHPYGYELELFRVEESRLQSISKAQLPGSIEKTPLVVIEAESQIDGLLEELLQQKEISVDLEHHSYRSFMGITCLLQISTREKDYIIDTLCLRHILYKLNEVFTKPSILKIFHSGDSDIEWLQRDLGLYVVNMFDTYQAAKVLSYPKLGLSYLLKKFCNVESNKKFQLYDWRIRPLPEAAKNYARTDTHYLIYIYEMMNNELLSRAGGFNNLLNVVYQRSTETCKRIYHKPLLTEDSYMTLYRKSKRLFDSRQLYALKEIYKWRDRMAREEDESPGYILSNHMMMQICQTLPREMQGILACCNPIPPSVRQHLITLHNIVLKAKDQPLIMPLVEESAKPSSQFSASRDFDIEAKISTYIHDNSGLEFRDDYPTLLGQQKHHEEQSEDHGLKQDIISMSLPKLSLIVNTIDEFVDLDKNGSSEQYDADVEEVTNIIEKVKFMTPYQRYKQVLPYSRKLEEEEREKQRIEEERIQQRLLQTQYSIPPPSDLPENEETQESPEDTQEKENILKRPIEAKAEPLSADCRQSSRFLLKIENSALREKRRPQPTRTSFKKGSQTLYSVVLFRGSLR